MTVFANHVTLFIVEDDELDFISIKRSLKKMCIANPIVRARDGQQAFEMLKSNQIQSPFVVLMDLQMPRLTGLELLEKLRRDSQLEDTVVFVLTTSDNEKDIEASYQHNVAGYFVKDELGQDVIDVISLLDGYWRIVHLPNKNHSS